MHMKLQTYVSFLRKLYSYFFSAVNADIQFVDLSFNVNVIVNLSGSWVLVTVAEFCGQIYP